MVNYPLSRTFQTLTEALQAETVERLTRLINLFPDSPRGTRKHQLVEFLVSRMDDDTLRDIWSRLEPIEQSAIAETVHSPGLVFDAERFRAKYDAPVFGIAQGYDDYVHRTKALLLQLFFFRGALPADLKKRLKAFVPKPVPTALASIDTLADTVELARFEYESAERRRTKRILRVPLHQVDTEQVAQRELLAVLRLVSTGKLDVSDKTRLPAKATTAAISAILLGGDFYDRPRHPAARSKSKKIRDEIGPIRGLAWPMILQAAGLAEATGTRLKLSRAGQRALSAPPSETLRGAWARWVTNKLFDEFHRIDVIKGQRGLGALTPPHSRRSVIVKALKRCPVGRWIGVDDFGRFMIASAIDFDVARNPWDLYVADPNYGILGNHAGSQWALLQGRYLMCLLFEYAATLGLVDVAYIPPEDARVDYSDLWGVDDLASLSRYDGLFFFRVNQLGAFSLGMTGRYTPTERAVRPRLAVHSNLEVAVVRGELEPDDTTLLDLYAERRSLDTWILDRGRILASVDAGHDAKSIRPWLEAVCIQPLPAKVEQFLADVVARARSIRDLGSARLIECRDAELARQIASDPKTRSLCKLAGSRHIVVPASSEDRFRETLRQLGYAVAIAVRS